MNIILTILFSGLQKFVCFFGNNSDQFVPFNCQRAWPHTLTHFFPFGTSFNYSNCFSPPPRSFANIKWLPFPLSTTWLSAFPAYPLDNLPHPSTTIPPLVCIHICTLATFSLPPFNWHIQHFECPIFLLSDFFLRLCHSSPLVLSSPASCPATPPRKLLTS